MKASDNVFPSVLFQDRNDDPDQPGEDTARLYIKDGVVFLIDDAGGITAVGVVEELGDLDDVNTADEVAGEFVRFDGTFWVNSVILVGDLPAHASTHEQGGSDEINVAGLPGVLADDQPPQSHGNEAHDDNLVGEVGVINAMTEKATPHDNDLLVIEDSEDAFNPKKVPWSALPEGGGGGGVQLDEENTWTALQTFSDRITSPHTGTQSERFGALAVASGFHSFAAGYEARATDTRAVAVGHSAEGLAINSVCVGGRSSVSSSSIGSIVLGENSTSWGARDSITIGQGIFNEHERSICLGSTARPSQDHQFVVGSDSVHNNRIDYIEIGRSTSRPPIIYGDTSGVGIGTDAPNASAKLEVNSDTQGFLPPRMTGTERDEISSPAAGLIIYNTTTDKLNFYNGTAWRAVDDSAV